ncbi:hypothetical protein COEREDRAFT_78931, partial [Coemansia reversa NRRL 1564]
MAAGARGIWGSQSAQQPNQGYPRHQMGQSRYPSLYSADASCEAADAENAASVNDFPAVVIVYNILCSSYAMRVLGLTPPTTVAFSVVTLVCL